MYNAGNYAAIIEIFPVNRGVKEITQRINACLKVEDMWKENLKSTKT